MGDLHGMLIVSGPVQQCLPCFMEIFMKIQQCQDYCYQFTDGDLGPEGHLPQTTRGSKWYWQLGAV